MIVLNIKSGQQAPYQDSVYEYRIQSNDEPDKVLEHCLAEIHRCDKDNFTNDISQCSGHCGFPFGLSSFYHFRKLGDKQYLYIVVDPYND